MTYALPPLLARPRLFLPGLLLLCCVLTAHAQPFTFYLQPHDLANLHLGTALWGDVDGDGDLDLLLSGGDQGPHATLYRYAGLQAGAPGFPGTATYDVVQTLDGGGWHSTGAWGDYDNDGDLDLAFMGGRQADPPYAATADVYRNDGGTFTATGASLPGLLSGALAWGDYDNDGDLDLVALGARPPDAATYHTDVYRNDGGTFTATGAGLPGLFGGTAEWGDYDADGDLDLLLSGTSQERFLTEVYRNDGGTLTALDAGLLGLLFSAARWGDYDNDGDLDILASGARLGPAVLDGYTRLYRNDGGSFTALDADVRGAFYGAATWGDYDNDGLLDFLVMGNTQPLGQRVGRFYQGDGATFRYASNLPGTFLGSAAPGDLDGDGDLDLLTLGADAELVPRTLLYLNQQRLVNQPPAPPADLQAAAQAGAVTLRWAAASDAETPAAGLTYNLRVGTTPGGVDVVSPMADPATGARYLSARGNVGSNTRWTLRGLPAGTYHWSVQALDHSTAASAFAAEGTFSVNSNSGTATATEGTGLPTRLALHVNYPNPFRDATTISYDLPEPTPVVLRIYNVLGEEVHTLVHGTQAAGRQTITWRGTDAAGRRLGPGVYFYRLHAGTQVLSRTLLLIN